jgi:uncharacterized integral membrane protein
MRWVYLAIIVIFAAAIIIFGLQNLGNVTVTFLRSSLDVPVIVLVFIVYVLGAVTGGSLFGLLRRSYEGAGIRAAHS